MSNFVQLQPDYIGELPVEQVLDSAKDECAEVLVLGWNEDGELYLASSTGDKREHVYLLNSALHRIMSGDYDAE